MQHETDDLRIIAIKELSTPAQVHEELPITETAAETAFAARQAIHKILHDEDDRLLVVVGPCSVHDPTAAVGLRPAPAAAARRAEG